MGQMIASVDFEHVKQKIFTTQSIIGTVCVSSPKLHNKSNITFYSAQQVNY